MNIGEFFVGFVLMVNLKSSPRSSEYKTTHRCGHGTTYIKHLNPRVVLQCKEFRHEPSGAKYREKEYNVSTKSKGNVDFVCVSILSKDSHSFLISHSEPPNTFL